jgi:uncharacterized membrane protein YheB (UPF0754 family)
MYLITPESLQKRILNDTSKQNMKAFVGAEVKKLLTTEKSIAELLEQYGFYHAAFSVQMLEEVVVSIAKRELAMITYIGVLLGGIIGLFQGLLVVFI